MTGSQLKALRLSRNLTQPELSNYLGDSTASMVCRWEKDLYPIPAWVEEKLLASTELQLPLDQLQRLMHVASTRGLDFGQLLTQAIRAYLDAPTGTPPSPTAPIEHPG